MGFTYRQVQSMTGHKDIRMVVRYDHERLTFSRRQTLSRYGGGFLR